MLAIQTQNQISAVLGRRPCAAGQPFSVLTRGCGRPERITAALGGDPGQLQRQPCRGGSSGPEAPRSGAGSRGRAPAATMGKGEGAVDKNMRKELSLEIDGHACAPVRESHRRHATDATPRRCPDQYVNDFTPLEFEEIVDLFKEFDKDKSGYIDEEELCEMMRALEMDHSLAKAKEVLTRREKWRLHDPRAPTRLARESLPRR